METLLANLKALGFKPLKPFPEHGYLLRVHRLFKRDGYDTITISIEVQERRNNVGRIGAWADVYETSYVGRRSRTQHHNYLVNGSRAHLLRDKPVQDWSEVHPMYRADYERDRLSRENMFDVETFDDAAQRRVLGIAANMVRFVDERIEKQAKSKAEFDAIKPEGFDSWSTLERLRWFRENQLKS